MNTAMPILSRYGKRVIRWDEATFDETLVMLRRERQAGSFIAGDNNSLLAQAEQIKHEATNQIYEVDAMQ